MTPITFFHILFCLYPGTGIDVANTFSFFFLLLWVRANPLPIFTWLSIPSIFTELSMPPLYLFLSYGTKSFWSSNFPSFLPKYRLCVLPLIIYLYIRQVNITYKPGKIQYEVVPSKSVTSPLHAYTHLAYQFQGSGKCTQDFIIYGV